MDRSRRWRPKGIPGRKKCILSCDGGGVRGIIISVILERLESHLQNLEGEDVRIADYFDGFAGTSTGGLIACLLVLPDPVTKRPKYSAKDVINFYLKNSAKIFPPKSRVARWSASLMGPLYSSTPLEKLLKEVFGDLKLSETVKSVIVPSYDINYQTTVQFSKAQVNSKKIPDCFIRDVCRATTAAPTFFAPYYFSSMTDDGVKIEFNMVDGGICANNPAFIAVSEFLRDDFRRAEFETPFYATNGTTKIDGLGSILRPKFALNQGLNIESSFKRIIMECVLKYEDLFVLSLGTGKSTVRYSAKTTAKWNSCNWIYINGKAPILDIFTMASQDTVEINMSNTFFEQCSHDNYLRIQTDQLEESQMKMDNSTKSNLESLVASAEKLLQSQVQMRNRFGELVPDPRWTTYDEALSKFAYWLVEEKIARRIAPANGVQNDVKHGCSQLSEPFERMLINS